ncbi:VOC family protein [Nocardia huaxiensis]|uniref:VOC family protein n=1 Tax=Nocardia huaxiensis TaxID=2755382 RepID=A0A7D6ZG35_9NOCA|nr:VOC family protein [Nocardia huaxiensis]QLY32858.1 VOC family protein [Nocardia huaxiensis]UFS93386.1 VOC family protein [Nocardia huaxiensis]
MPIQRLNHAVLFVSDVERSAAFYGEVLGFRRLPGGFPGAVFLQAEGSANDHDLGLFQSPDPATPARTGRVGLYHLAWEVDTLAELQRISETLRAAGALTGASDHGSTKALYAADPDGIEFEVCWLVPDAAVEAELAGMASPSSPLDLPGLIAKYGAETPGGPRTDHEVWRRLFADRG